MCLQITKNSPELLSTKPACAFAPLSKSMGQPLPNHSQPSGKIVSSAKTNAASSASPSVKFNSRAAILVPVARSAAPSAHRHHPHRLSKTLRPTTRSHTSSLVSALPLRPLLQTLHQHPRSHHPIRPPPPRRRPPTAFVASAASRHKFTSTVHSNPELLPAVQPIASSSALRAQIPSNRCL